MRSLTPEPLTNAAFAPFGEVIETGRVDPVSINQGSCERFNDLAGVDTGDAGGRSIVSLFRGRPFSFPIEIAMLERHPLGSQAFMPLNGRPWLVVVADADADGAPAGIRAFSATGQQGVNYAKGVWHHPLLALEQVSDFLVIDRAGPGNNLEEIALPEHRRVAIAARVMA